MAHRAKFVPSERRLAGAARIALLASALALALAATAAAQQAPPSVLRVTVNHAVLLRLGSAPAVALIADPQIADIVNERDNLMFVLGRKPGATNLLAFDSAGHRLLDREIVVVPENANMVTITRNTDATDYTCAPRCAMRAHALTQGQAPSEIGATSQGPAGAAPSAAGAPPAMPGP